MGLLDNLGGSLKGVFGDVEAAAIPALLSSVLARTDLGGLQGLANQLTQGGLGAQVQSWLGSGANMHVTPEQIRAALGNEQVQALAQKFGVPVDGVLKLLSEHGPGVIDQASPDGKIQS
jgi:uncharacterized protein YidB (DUF937 family)